MCQNQFNYIGHHSEYKSKEQYFIIKMFSLIQISETDSYLSTSEMIMYDGSLSFLFLFHNAEYHISAWCNNLIVLCMIYEHCLQSTFSYIINSQDTGFYDVKNELKFGCIDEYWIVCKQIDSTHLLYLIRLQYSKMLHWRERNIKSVLIPSGYRRELKINLFVLIFS